jgi:hypothetical protein
MPPILQNYLTAISNKYGTTNDESFEILVAALVLDKPFDEVHQKVWVGSGDDGGFDNVYIDDQTNTLHLFQCKNSASLKENELMKLDQDFTDLFVNDNRSGRNINQRLQAWIAEYKDYTNRGVVLTPKLHFAYSGLNTDSAHANNSSLSSRFSGRATVPSYSVLDSNDLVLRITNLQKERRNQVNFTFRPLETNIATFSNQAFYSFSIGQVVGASFRINALHLCELMEEEIRVNGSPDSLYSENIRGYLGNNKTNKRIKQTLRDPGTSIFFPFMNNGLTIICETVTIPQAAQAGVYNIPVVNPVIVNGLQTSKIIYDTYKEDPSLLENITVTLKVYESRDRDLTELITEATNTQTSINFKDQMSNKIFNRWAHDFFASQRIKFISKRGEIVRGDNLSDGLQDSVNNETVFKFWYATFNKDPRVAKISKTTVLENIFLATKGENPPLNDLFSGDPHSPIYRQLYIAYLIYKVVSEKRQQNSENEGQDFLLHADEIISYGVYLALDAQGIDNNTDESHILPLYEGVKNIVERIVGVEKARRGENYAHTKYFKSDAVVDDYNQEI